MRTFITSLLLVFTLVGMAQEKVLLRVNYKAGDDYKLTMNMSQVGAIEMQTDLTLHIVDVKDTITSMEFSVDRIKMSMSQDGMEMSYDSDTKTEDMDEMGTMMHAQFAPMLEAKVSTKTTHRAEVIETIVEPQVPGMENMANTAGSVKYPEEALAVGESWSETKIDNGMEMKIDYTIATIEDDIVTIDVSGTIGLVADGTLTGLMIIDRASGNVNSAVMNMNMTASGQEMNMQIKATTTKI